MPLPGVASLSARAGRTGPGLSITPRHAGRPVAQMHAGAGSARGAHRGAALRAFWRAPVNRKPCRLDCPYAPERFSAQLIFCILLKRFPLCKRDFRRVVLAFVRDEPGFIRLALASDLLVHSEGVLRITDSLLARA